MDRTGKEVIKFLDDLQYAVTLHECAADVETKARAIKLIKEIIGLTEDTDD
jgi:hypothetical protein